MTFVKVDIKQLEQDLKTNVIEIYFEKKDGNKRLMKATLQAHYIAGHPITEAEMTERFGFLNDGQQFNDLRPVMHAWDVEEHGWRSFRTDKLLSFPQITNG